MIKSLGPTLRDLLWGWLLAYSSNPRRTRVWLLASVLAGLAPVAMLLGLKLALDTLLGHSPRLGISIAHPLSLLLALISASYALTAAARWLSETLTADVRRHVLRVLLNKVDTLAPAQFDDLDFQNLLHRARTDALNQPHAILTASGALLQTGLFFGGILAYLALQSWLYPALLIGASIPAVLISGAQILHSHRARKSETMARRIAGYSLWMLMDRNSVQELRQTAADRMLSRRFEAESADLDASAQQRSDFSFLGNLTTGLVMLLSVGIGLWWMMRQFGAGQISTGSLAISFYAFVMAHRIASQLLGAFARLYRGGLFLSDLRAILDTPIEHVGKATRRLKPALPPRDGIRFEGVSFRYPGEDTEAVSDLNLHIPAGQVTVLTGPNGCGKSTVLRLIAGVYQPTAGRITIDGVPLEEIDQDYWRSRVALQFQEPIRIATSLRENIELARQAETLDWRTAQEFGQLDSLLAKLPEGERTQLLRSMGGHDLSGGEWQRLALARAVAGKPGIMLLDEPTSALDPEARAHHWANLERFAVNRTIIAASHDAGLEALAHIVRLPEIKNRGQTP